MLQFITSLVLVREYFKNKFNNLDYHSIYRSWFCLLISILSSCTMFINWDTFIENPLITNSFSYILNTFMIVYMGYDIICFLINEKLRIDLLCHHILCLIIFIFYREHLLLTFYSICEVISAFNWIGIIYPNYNWITRILRAGSIIFVRLWVWIFGLKIMYSTEYFNIILLYTIIFITLDMYWLSIIYNNFKKRNTVIQKYIKKYKNLD